MAKQTALTKITAKAKKIRRAHPKKSWKSAVKQASSDYRAGRLSGPVKKKRKKAVARKVARPRKRKRARVSGIGPSNRLPVIRETQPRTRSRVGAHKPKRRRKKAVRHTPRRHTPRRARRVGNSSSTSNMLMGVGLVAGLGLLAYAVWHKSSVAPTAPTGLVQTGNNYRDQTASNILAWATAGGMAGDLILKLINALNKSDSNTVSQVQDSIDSGEGLPYGFIA